MIIAVSLIILLLLLLAIPSRPSDKHIYQDAFRKKYYSRKP
jgi:hypothetical protein